MRVHSLILAKLEREREKEKKEESGDGPRKDVNEVT